MEKTKEPRVDAFVNVTILHEQTGGRMADICTNLNYEINHRLSRLLNKSWCPEDIKADIRNTIRYLSKALTDAVSVQTYLADHSRSVPEPVATRICDPKRLFKLVVIQGTRGQGAELPAVASEGRAAQ
ncbi:MAG: hypothetical protein NT047_07525 [Deltaproteobacteria bacterium]|nr:hypothetical protein [Deltaproteobacteria bacterium]